MADSRVFPAIIKATYDPSGGFPKMVQDAQRASGQIRKQFESDFATIGQLGEKALSLPRNAGGSLDLGVDEYKRAAEAARVHAIALREIATASASAAKASGDTTRLTQTYVQAASAAAREAEEQAQSVNATALSYERLQAELNKTKSATDAVVASAGRGTTAYQANTQSVRAMRQATTQAGQQLQDIVISMGSGQRASTVLAQQLPQLAFAFSDVGGKVGAVARFLSGPWGVAIAIGAFALGPFIDKLLQGEDATERQARASRTFIEVLNDQTTSVKELTKATEDYNKEAERSTQTTLDNLQADAKAVQSNLLVAQSKRERVKAILEEIQNESLLQTVLKGGNPIQNIAIQRQLRGLATQALADQNAAIVALEQTAETIGGKLATEIAKINTDPKYQLNVGFEKLRNDARASIKDFSKLQAELERINKQEKAADDAQKASSRSSSGLPKVTDTEVAGLLGFDKFGGRRSAARNKAVGGAANSYHLSGQAIDIPLTLNGKPLTKEGIRSELEAAGVIIKELLGPGDKGHNDHFHVAFSKRRAGSDEIGKRREAEIERAARAAETLQNNLDSISVAVTRIGGEFDRQPRFIDRATLAAEKLKLVIAEIDKTLAGKDLTEGQRKNLEEQRKSAENTLQNEIPRAVRQPFDDVTKQSERELELQNLRLAGREVEAQLLQSQFDLMQRYNAETEEELATALAKAGITKQEYLTQLDIQKVLLTNRNIEQERLALLGQTIEDRISRLNELRESAISTIADAAATGNVSFKNIFDTINRQFADQFARKFFDQFLGGAFQSEEDRLRNLKNRADGQLIVSTTRVADAMDSLAASAQGLATGTPANDNLSSDAADVRQEAAIIVSGVRNGNKDFARLITKSLEGLLGEGSVLASDIGSAVSGALEGAQLGGFLGSAFGSGGGKVGRGLGAILGGANSLIGGTGPLASAFAALPQVGAVLQASSAISSLLGNDQVKGGKTIGVIAPFLTALFGSSLRGSATVGGVNGSLAVTGTRGNSKSRKASATDSANTVIEQINAIAEQLGGGLNASAGSASIGIRKKNFILDPTGQGRTKGAGTINFGKDEKAAIAAARALALDLINDGVITGLRAGSQKLLANAKSLEAGLEKALKFQSVFDRLDAIKNPLGSAINTLNREFTGLIGIFREAGASAEEFASLEELYGLERARIIEQQSQELTGSLRNLIDELKQGDNGLALRDRLANVRSQFDPLAATIRAGGTVDYDRFTELARQVIDIQRQISGSQIDYFSTFNEILGLSEQALAGQQNVVSIGSGLTSPFSGTSAPSNASTPVVGAINSQTSTLVASLAAIQAQIANQNFAPSKLYASNGFSLGGLTYF
jgi:hypothetical protein